MSPIVSNLASLWDFFKPSLKNHKNRLIVLALFPIVWCLVETIAPFLIKMVIDRLAGDSSFGIQTQNMLVYLVISYAALIFILEISTRSCNYVWISVFPKIRADLQSKALTLLQNRDFQFFYNQLSGDLVSRYRTLTNSFETLVKIVLYGFYPTVLSFLFSLLFISAINGFFALLFLVWFLAMNLVTFFFFPKNITASQEQAKNQNLLMGYIADVLGNTLTMMTFPQNLSVERDFLELKEGGVSSTEHSEFVTFKADIWRSLFSWILLVCMIVFLSLGWQKNWITLGDFSFIAAICFYIRRSIWMTAQGLSDFFKELGAAKEAHSLIFDDRLNTQKTCETGDLPPLSDYAIDFSQIRFGYSWDRPLFNKVNLHIPSGQKLGISGDSGAGKTSLIHLLLRLHDPDQGTILINGEDYRKMSVNHLRNFFSYVPQNAMLLHRSIFDNIAFGRISASKEEVYEAAKRCLCDEFVHSIKGGYKAIVGEGGCALSGGQRQRIAIARAYLKKAPVFILDEATSALDLELEDRLFESLLPRVEDNTIILISHRASSLQRMDRIVKFEHGRISGDTFREGKIG